MKKVPSGQASVTPKALEALVAAIKAEAADHGGLRNVYQRRGTGLISVFYEDGINNQFAAWVDKWDGQFRFGPYGDALAWEAVRELKGGE